MPPKKTNREVMEDRVKLIVGLLSEHHVKYDVVAMPSKVNIYASFSVMVQIGINDTDSDFDLKLRKITNFIK